MLCGVENYTRSFEVALARAAVATAAAAATGCSATYDRCLSLDKMIREI